MLEPNIANVKFIYHIKIVKRAILIYSTVNRLKGIFFWYLSIE